MVGNDVVDLLDPDADPQRPRARFDARVCRPAEVRAIAAASDPSRERWCHWTAKEAAYKLLRKSDPQLVFSPVRFEVELEPVPVEWDGTAPACRRRPARGGRVAHGGVQVALVLRCEADAIHAVATLAGEAGVGEPLVGLRRLAAAGSSAPESEELGAAVRQLAVAGIARGLALAPERLAIVKRGRIPELAIDGVPSLAHSLSLSHHGRIVAFASVAAGSSFSAQAVSLISVQAAAAQRFTS